MIESFYCVLLEVTVSLIDPSLMQVALIKTTSGADADVRRFSKLAIQYEGVSLVVAIAEPLLARHNLLSIVGLLACLLYSD